MKNEAKILRRVSPTLAVYSVPVGTIAEEIEVHEEFVLIKTERGHHNVPLELWQRQPLVSDE